MHALDQGFHNIETDCQLSADEIPVNIHGEVLEKTTNGSGGVSSHTVDELQRLDAGSWFSSEFAGQRIPLLSEVLVLLAGAHLHLELKFKQPLLPTRVVEALRAAGYIPSAAAQLGHLQSSPAESTGRDLEGAEPRTQASDGAATSAGCRIEGRGTFGVPGLTITSFHLDQLQRSLKLLPHVRHAWLVQELDDGVLATAAAAAAAAGTAPLQLCPRANACTAEGVAAALSRGHSVRGWGVRSIEDLDRLRACGAHGCTVDWPDVARRHILENPCVGTGTASC
ncbi:hypothetical protein WJX81_006451 [Elliptochloris bilobata]|uniref:glycerophosphodiester phosphodiesterase n=1 Tax=Elliptochloris bilobata TaxID=381761 RepID=A0AAW1RIU8_9CHLO